MIFVEARRKVGKNGGWRRDFVVFDLANGRRDRAGGNLNGKLHHRVRDKCIFWCKRDTSLERYLSTHSVKHPRAFCLCSFS